MGTSKERDPLPRGGKDAYTDKQKRKAKHIAESYEQQGVPNDEAEHRAWATVNKESGDEKKSGSVRGKAARDGSATSRKNVGK